jgi:hypothetical protein
MQKVMCDYQAGDSIGDESGEGQGEGEKGCDANVAVEGKRKKKVGAESVLERQQGLRAVRKKKKKHS